MRVLALNCGSSSVKAAIVDAASGERLLDVRIEGLGAETIVVSGGERRAASAPTRLEALRIVLEELHKHTARFGSVEAVAHRIVHGGERLTQPTLIDERVEAVLDGLTPLAPLHNLPALEIVRAARSALPDIPHVAVFDTAFHSALPQHAREYALPEAVRRRHGLRRYGFHGINHEHVMRAVSDHLRAEPSKLRIISCHLGAGASVAAIERGRSVDTSMGMTPLEGLVMATRAGDLDPGLVLTLLRESGEPADLDDLLNKRSGLLGLTGSADMREIERRAAAGEQACRLALAIYVHRIRKYLGGYAAVMGGVEVIAFTGGVGEHSELIRRGCLERLDFLGVTLDEDRNRNVHMSLEQPVAEICAARSRTRALVVRADEEQALARAAAALIRGQEPARPVGD